MKSPPHENVDEDLVDGLRSGEVTRDDFIAKAWETYAQRLTLLARHMGTPSTNVEDVVAQAFLSLAERAQKGEVPRNLSAYLVASVRNLVITTQQNTKHHRWKLEKRPELSAADWDLALMRDDALRRDDAMRAVRDAMSKLADQERALLMLRFVEGASISQIAEQTHLSYSTVASRLFRSLRKLREKLQEETIYVH